MRPPSTKCRPSKIFIGFLQIYRLPTVGVLIVSVYTNTVLTSTRRKMSASKKQRACVSFSLMQYAPTPKQKKPKKYPRKETNKESRTRSRERRVEGKLAPKKTCLLRRHKHEYKITNSFWPRSHTVGANSHPWQRHATHVSSRASRVSALPLLPLNRRLRDAAALKVTDHDGHLRALGSLCDEGKFLEEGVGRGRLDLDGLRGDHVCRRLLRRRHGRRRVPRVHGRRDGGVHCAGHVSTSATQASAPEVVVVQDCICVGSRVGGLGRERRVTARGSQEEAGDKPTEVDKSRRPEMEVPTVD